MRIFRFCPLLVLALGAATPALAGLAVWLTPTLPQPQPVGTSITNEITYRTEANALIYRSFRMKSLYAME